MINIGCDIGKNDFDVYFLGKHNFRIIPRGLFLAMCSKNTDIRVVLEPTGGYEKQLIRKLFETKTQVNPYYVRDFARSFRDLA